MLALVALRFAFTPPPSPTHYHANFAIFIDGRRLDRSADRYMEELSACRLKEGAILPAERVHLHSGNPDVVHVHQPALTQSQFSSVAATAEQFNRGVDPAGCSGTPAPTLRERLLHSLAG